jgi:hypothetical protein
MLCESGSASATRAPTDTLQHPPVYGQVHLGVIRVEKSALEPAAEPAVARRRDDGEWDVVDEADASLTLLLERRREQESVDGPGEVLRRGEQDARVKHVEQVVLGLVERLVEVVELRVRAKVGVACPGRAGQRPVTGWAAQSSGVVRRTDDERKIAPGLAAKAVDELLDDADRRVLGRGDAEDELERAVVLLRAG